MSAPAARVPAAKLVAKHLDLDTRVLVLGAGGWFGSTGLELLADSGSPIELLALTGRPRILTHGSRSWPLVAWDWGLVERFAPSLVLNCAFLTRDRVEQVGTERFVAENMRLTAHFLRTLRLPTVTAALTISSGAATAQADRVPDFDSDPYGYLKWCEEVLAAEVAASSGVALVVARAWSVTGPLVGQPRGYAFSDLILQATSGRIAIRSASEVWRRYVGVDELLAVCLAHAASGSSRTIDSGGPLVEIGDLATRIASILAPQTTVERPPPDGAPADHYHSDNHSWDEACRELGYTPATLDEQITMTAAGLLRP